MCDLLAGAFFLTKKELPTPEQVRREGNEIILTNYEGKEYRYPDYEPVS